MRKITFERIMASVAVLIGLLGWLFPSPIQNGLLHLLPSKDGAAPSQPARSIKQADDRLNNAPIAGVWRETNQISTNSFDFLPGGKLIYVNEGVTYPGTYTQDPDGTIKFSAYNGEKGELISITDNYVLFQIFYKGNTGTKKYYRPFSMTVPLFLECLAVAIITTLITFRVIPEDDPFFPGCLAFLIIVVLVYFGVFLSTSFATVDAGIIMISAALSPILWFLATIIRFGIFGIKERR